MYSRRVRSVVILRYGLKDPKAKRLNNQIEYPAPNTIELAPNNAAIGLFWNAPISESNSPTQLTEIPGVPMLANVNKKNSDILKGMYNTSPR